MTKEKLHIKPKTTKKVKIKIIKEEKGKLINIDPKNIMLIDPTDIDIDIETEITGEDIPKEKPKKEKNLPKYKRSIMKQTSIEFNKKIKKIEKFIELPHIKRLHRFSIFELHNGILIYQGSRTNPYAIFRKCRYDNFVKTSTKKLFISTLGRFNLDLEEDYNV